MHRADAHLAGRSIRLRPIEPRDYPTLRKGELRASNARDERALTSSTSLEICSRGRLVRRRHSCSGAPPRRPPKSSRSAQPIRSSRWDAACGRAGQIAIRWRLRARCRRQHRGPSPHVRLGRVAHPDTSGLAASDDLHRDTTSNLGGVAWRCVRTCFLLPLHARLEASTGMTTYFGGWLLPRRRIDPRAICSMSTAHINTSQRPLGHSANRHYAG